ncbi:hypothetical protein [Halomonas sp. 3F2F]|uniref:hypothetical protein n=1 Tax=Halomonas sp. 3F2F TaxID=1255602 RepID=UPI001867D378|nr:hypothetical protein [Halomonas sp. 3F2F]
MSDFNDFSLISGVFKDGEYEIKFSYHPGVTSEKLIVFFPGAYDRTKGTVQYQRHSWVVDYVENSHCLVVDDPTINENNDLKIGWFQGWPGIDLFDGLRKLVLSICDEIGVDEKNIVFFGSSAGGFVSLKMTELFTDSTSIAINPQIYLNRFYKSGYEAMMDYSYKTRKLDARISSKITYSPDFFDRQGKVYIFQNLSDEYHVANHIGVLLNGISDDAGVSEFQIKEFCNVPKSNSFLNVVYYEDVIKKHNPPSREDTRDIINSICFS